MALGAVRAFEECGRENECCAVGASLDAEKSIRLAAATLAGHSVPPAVFTKHQMVTRENVDRMCPLDGVCLNA